MFFVYVGLLPPPFKVYFALILIVVSLGDNNSLEDNLSS